MKRMNWRNSTRTNWRFRARRKRVSLFLDFFSDFTQKLAICHHSWIPQISVSFCLSGQKMYELMPIIYPGWKREIFNEGFLDDDETDEEEEEDKEKERKMELIEKLRKENDEKYVFLNNYLHSRILPEMSYANYFIRANEKSHKQTSRPNFVDPWKLFNIFFMYLFNRAHCIFHYSTTRFSRTCHYCTTAEPHSRAVFVACGHAVCRDCADEFVIQMDARECPICLAVGEHKPLYEDLDDESRWVRELPRWQTIRDILWEFSRSFGPIFRT